MVSGAVWYLEGWIEAGASGWRTAIDSKTFLIGRSPDCHLQLERPGISSHHAEICAGFELTIRDLGSTNGTFVNYARIEEPVILGEGDVVHFADQEFHLTRRLEASNKSTVALDLAMIREAKEALRQRPELERMIDALDVTIHFQPLFRLRERSLFGFEMLGRGAVAGLPTSPVELFSAAEQHGLELPLARALRRQGAREARDLPLGSRLFFNTHPGELNEPELLAESLLDLRAALPDAAVVLEIHEMSLTDLAAFQPVREALSELDILLAFDDFGKGRSRLLELAELSPDYLKFDRSLIETLDQAERRRDLVATLVGMVREMHIETLAEGIETAGEADVCESLGFDFAQGYYFGRPQLVEAFAPRTEERTEEGDSVNTEEAASESGTVLQAPSPTESAR